MRRALAIALLVPREAAAHTSEGGFVLLLPTGWWMAGGAAAVMISFAMLALAPGGPPAAATREGRDQRAAVWAGWIGFAAFAALIAIGFFGPSDPGRNLLPLTLWTMLWVAFTGLVALTGNLWRHLNPWQAPARLLPVREPPGPLRRTGPWVAVAGMIALGWFELISLHPEDPRHLATVALIYGLSTFAMTAIAGRWWLDHGEVLGVFYGLVGRLSPLTPAVSRAKPLPLAAMVFLCTALATVTFDGLKATFFWLGLIGINPLDFPGRSSVVGVNTLGYLATVLAMTAAFTGAVLLGLRLAPGPNLRAALGRLVLSLLPIALGYHLSHYLTNLLVNGQYWLAALSDPLGSGTSLTGYDRHDVTTSFFHVPAAVEAIWTVQALLVIGGHVWGVWIAHRTALSLYPGDTRAAVRSQLPLAVLMVLYTLLGLWLLAAPKGA